MLRTDEDKVNILLVDDQQAKLLAYEVILQNLGENLIRASSGREALAYLLKSEVAVVLIDVSMPELDGFQLAAMIRDHPRFAQTAIIFVSAIHFTDVDRIRGYAMGAVDYVPVPVIPEVLRAKVRVFVDLYRKTRQLERMNDELERRVSERTAELQAAIERQSILAREVDHRAKNALAVVQSIVRLTRAHDVKGYVAAVEGRIQALSRAHSLLSQSRWEGASLEQIVTDELAPYRTAERHQLLISGPGIVLQPVAAQALALALHELATNAAKHGALATPRGRVSVGWNLMPDSLIVSWRESDGPAVEPPTNAGFGTKLIHASVEGQLAGHASFEWHADGLRCTMDIPRGNQLERLGDTGSAKSSKINGSQVSPRLNEKHVLLVEDESLIAMMMAELLEEMGFGVVGPYARLHEAIAGAEQHELDAAVLDINLGGELVYPLADRLAARGIPFLFVTGYSVERREGKFSEIPVLQKPIEKKDLERALSTIGQPYSGPEQPANARTLATP